jgi:radical SAM superfamily enzyme YgiQ (UPF0313 family)
MDQALTFEQGPIRPPSEAGSLLIRVTRNCPWNRCTFCGTYKGKKFSRRSIEQIKADIDAAKAVEGRIKEMSWALGHGGAMSQQVLTRAFSDPSLPDSFRSIALWLAAGGDTVFLQDANSLMLSTDSLITIIKYIGRAFPSVSRVTSYARGSTLKDKSVEDYVRLREAGLSRLHVGMESGSDKVLKQINKGCTSEQLIRGGKRVVEAGISLCLYVMPGIGGQALSEEHVSETARVVNAINPDYVRFRSLYVKGHSDLMDMVEDGSFSPPGEDEMVREIRGMIERLEGVQTSIVSDHILNLLEDVQGVLPRDRERILRTIDEYLSMEDEDRLLFQLGRRAGALRSLSDFRQPGSRAKLVAAKRQIEVEVPGGIPEYLQAIKTRFV